VEPAEGGGAGYQEEEECGGERVRVRSGSNSYSWLHESERNGTSFEYCLPKDIYDSHVETTSTEKPLAKFVNHEKLGRTSPRSWAS
jgi:hypothetical protein